jgi:hypothetical protein
MNTPKGKPWDRRRTNQKARRILKNDEFLTGKVSGRRLNRSMWGCGLSRKDVVGNPTNNLEPEFVERMSCGEFHVKGLV